MSITFKGNPITIKKQPLQVGDTLTDFRIVKNDLSEITLADTKGKRIFLSVPSLDTGVCSLEVEKFMQYIRDAHDVTCYSVSYDLPFALDRWCQAKENENVITASDYKFHSFGEASATFIEELGLLTRAVFLVDKDNVVRYVEYVSEVANEPNYDAVLNALADIK